MSDIYSTLNPQQQEAVYHTEGPLLILAGAGSGKTRVLTHRIAYLIDKKGINPWNILAITFTNKAASEMRERVDKIVGFGSESVWVSTFHSTCVRILRRYIDRLGYDTRFAIYDTEDQKTLMKEVCRKLNIDTKKTKERSLLAQISHAKDELITPDEMELNAGGDFVKKKVAEVYREYQAALRRNNALDFDDLIVKTVELLQTDVEGNTTVADRQTLTKENQWSYTWKNLSTLMRWSVSEAEVPKGYTVAVTREGNTVVLTNTAKKPGKSDGEVNPPSKKPTDKTTNKTTDKTSDKLPQTGQLWWPVLVLLFAGAICLLVGRVLRDRKEEKNR